ncbi:MAG: glutathione S-transferase [Rhodospirillaceae bacterium]|mgnify:FL=1|jgi:glutathione S-transferase|nr:glutathione S-transferase [Rhodospirillaceae bacterium]MBT5457793.1 glutathione S-transferase [Rhodospirillaceae bacterium]
MYTLYYSPGACSMAAHVLLEECGADYETRLVALAKGEQRSEEYRGINPHSKVPALAVDGKIITQNAAILPFIARQFPDADLMLGDPVAQAQCTATVGWLASTTHVAFSLVLHPERPAGGADIGEAGQKAISDTARATYWNCMEEIDTRLSDKQWMMGDQYTFLDPYALVYYGWGNRIQMPMADLAHYTAFKDRMIARPAVRTVLEKEQSPLLKAA